MQIMCQRTILFSVLTTDIEVKSWSPNHTSNNTGMKYLPSTPLVYCEPGCEK